MAAVHRTLALDGLDPLVLYGVNNAKFHVLQGCFPSLELVARGEEIRVEGDADSIGVFEERIGRLRDFYERHGELTARQIEAICSDGLLQPSIADGASAAQAAQETTGAGRVLVYGPHGQPVKARTPGQQELVKAVDTHDLVFVTGPAGTGKTYTAIALAVNALRRREVKRIVLTRPAVEAGERLGFLPGDMKEKLDPYLQPLYDALNDMLPPRSLQARMEDGTVQIAPLAYMRGRTLDQAYVILDEAQNATLGQLKMFLTRMGRNAHFMVTGDTTQIDLPDAKQSGLVRVMRLLGGVQGVATVELGQDDIVRHPLVGAIVNAFEKEAE